MSVKLFSNILLKHFYFFPHIHWFDNNNSVPPTWFFFLVNAALGSKSMLKTKSLSSFSLLLQNNRKIKFTNPIAE